eukprot:299142-Pleurochrysis_carterae.AAC.2
MRCASVARAFSHRCPCLHCRHHLQLLPQHQPPTILLRSVASLFHGCPLSSPAFSSVAIAPHFLLLPLPRPKVRRKQCTTSSALDLLIA